MESTGVKTRQAKITCEVCKETIEYEERYWLDKDGIDNSPVEDVPDGYFVPHYETNKWVWICDDCGSCPKCGASRVEPRKPRCEHQMHKKEQDNLRWQLRNKSRKAEYV